MLASAAKLLSYPNLLKVHTVFDKTSDRFLVSLGLSFCSHSVLLNLSSLILTAREGFPNLDSSSFSAS